MNHKLKKPISQTVSFTVETLDSFAQGVSHPEASGQSNFKIFIPKTLPGEEGSAEILKTFKNSIVVDPQTIQWKKKSKFRIEAECSHYGSCSGCDYLHTNYTEEITFKKEGLRKIVGGLTTQEGWETPPLHFFSAPARLHYRNRIQLHYSLNQKKLGFHQLFSNTIVEVPHCLLGLEKIQKKLKELYDPTAQNFWIKEVERLKLSPEGELEIYWIDEKKEIFLGWNKGYAHQGFSQVNLEMNQLLLAHINHWYQERSTSFSSSNSWCLDLFGGNGNLSRSFSKHQVLVVDQAVEQTQLKNHQKSLELDLYSRDSLSYLKQKLEKKSFDLILIDPPRSGFKDTSKFVNLFLPNYLIYFCCNWSILSRDLTGLGKNYSLEAVWCFDFFPSTQHFELVLIFKKNYAMLNS